MRGFALFVFSALILIPMFFPLLFMKDSSSSENLEWYKTTAELVQRAFWPLLIVYLTAFLTSDFFLQKIKGILGDRNVQLKTPWADIMVDIAGAAKMQLTDLRHFAPSDIALLHQLVDKIGSCPVSELEPEQRVALRVLKDNHLLIYAIKEGQIVINATKDGSKLLEAAKHYQLL